MITTAALAQIMAEQKCLHLEILLLVLSLIIVAVDRRRKSQEIPSQDWNFNEALAGSFCATAVLIFPSNCTVG